MSCLTTGKPLEMFQEYKNPLMWHSGPNSPPLLRLRHLGHHGSSNKTEKCGFLFTFKAEKNDHKTQSLQTDVFSCQTLMWEKNYLRRVGRKKWNKNTELRSWCCFCSWVYFPYPKTRNWQILNHELWVEKKKNANEAWHRYATWISLIWPISVFKVFFLFCFLLQKQNFLVWLLLYPVKVCKSDHWSKKKFHIWEMHEMPL